MKEKTKDNLFDFGTYFSNFVARPIGEAFKHGLNLGNPYVAIGFGILDLANNHSDKLKESKLNRLIKAGGAIYFTGKTIANLVSIAKSDFENSYNLPFNISLAYKFGKESIQFYNHNGNNLLKDLNAEKFGNFIKKKSNQIGEWPEKAMFWMKTINKNYKNYSPEDFEEKNNVKVDQNKTEPIEIYNRLKDENNKENSGVDATNVGNQLKRSSKNK